MKVLIYCLDCANQMYVGSTEQTWNQRMHRHKQAMLEYPERKVYTYIANNGGWNNVEITILEIYYCDTKIERFKRESYWKRNMGATLNMIRPICTDNDRIEDSIEYRKSNIEKIKQYDTERWANNTQRRIKHSEVVICSNCGDQSQRCNLARHRKSKKCKSFCP